MGVEPWLVSCAGGFHNFGQRTAVFVVDLCFWGYLLRRVRVSVACFGHVDSVFDDL